MLLKVDCLPNAVGKQPSIPLIYLGRKWTLNRWWWWWWCFDTEKLRSKPKRGCEAPENWIENCSLFHRINQLTYVAKLQAIWTLGSRVMPKFKRGRDLGRVLGEPLPNFFFENSYLKLCNLVYFWSENLSFTTPISVLISYFLYLPSLVRK